MIRRVDNVVHVDVSRVFRSDADLAGWTAASLTLSWPAARPVTPGHAIITAVFYFFKRGNETVQCEVRSEPDGPGYEIVITEPNGVQRIERFATSEQVHDRWVELHKRFELEGWWGPSTQDGRG